jgi:2-oxo-4-hydroxy-4-carboxy-5-ureidoimidazoline decarboxylase
MVARRPYHGESDLLDAADEFWWGLTETDWREAFASHPEIGDVRPCSGGSSQQEQFGMQASSARTRAALARLNRAYLVKFGYIYIVCATGKTGEEMLAILEMRLPNDPATEIRIAAEEQSKITRLRLSKMLRS